MAFLSSPGLGRLLEIIGYAAKTARYLYPTEPTVFFAELATERLVKTHTSALQKELKRQEVLETNAATRAILIEELTAFENIIMSRQQLTEDRILRLLRSAFNWEAEGGHVELSRAQRQKLDRADRAFHDLLLATEMLRSNTVHRCTIELANTESIRYLNWLLFPPRTLVIGAAFEGELKFSKCLSPGRWTDDAIRIIHSLVREAGAGVQLQLVTEYVWAKSSATNGSLLKLDELASAPAVARRLFDSREAPLETILCQMPVTIELGTEPKTLLLPTKNLKARVSALRLRAYPAEQPLLIYDLSPAQ